MRDGVILVATGAGYVELALQALATIRRWNPGLPVDLFTDLPGASGVERFDRIHPVPRSHARAKLDCLPLSRFERTLFLDCDVLVCAAFGDLFDVLDRFDLALAHDVRRRSALVRAGLAETTPYAFPQMNSGVLLYRKTPRMLAFLAEWARRFHDSGAQRDQTVLKDLLWRSDVRFYVLPPEFNLRRVTVLDAWEPLDARPTIVHSHRLLQHLRGAPERVSSLSRLVDLERTALKQEWATVGKGEPPGDPLARYRAVEED